MEFEVIGDRKLLGTRVIPRHNRSKSFPDKRGPEEDHLDGPLEEPNHVKLDTGHLKECVTTEKKSTPKMQGHSSLKEEILQLEKCLKDQFVFRHALEKALGYRSSPFDTANEITFPKPEMVIIKEIAVLELEVMHLEQYLLSLYRKAFDGQLSSISPSTNEERLKSKSAFTTPKCRLLKVVRHHIASNRKSPAVKTSGIREETLDDSSVRRCHSSLSQRSGISTEVSQEKLWCGSNRYGGEEELVDSRVRRCHSSLSHCSGFLTRDSPPDVYSANALHDYHSKPLSMMLENDENVSSNLISLAEHLGTRISDHVSETPNRLSEEMIKCISAIYCKLANPPSTNHGLLSPNSSLLSIGAFSPHDQSDMWSPGLKNNPSIDVRLDNPFHVEGLKEFSGPYSSMVEVPWIYRDGQKLNDIEPLLKNFRSLISQLQEVDPRRLNHEEKLAFWINVHNALLMHAYLTYGIPQNNVKRVFLVLKAAYSVGGHTISADMIQSSILGCRVSRPGQWLQMILSSKTKFRTGDERQAYSIDRREPLLHFALCSGSHSDPAVRVYTPKRIFQELEAAKEEYIRATFGVRKAKEQKLLLPKLVDSYAKDSSLCPAVLMEMIQQSLPETVRKSVQKCPLGKSRKSIEWNPHNYTFRYLISRELVK